MRCTSDSLAAPRRLLASMSDPAGSLRPSVRLPEKLAAQAAACSFGEAAKAFSPERPNLARSFCLRVCGTFPLRRRLSFHFGPVSPTQGVTGAGNLSQVEAQMERLGASEC